MTESLRGRIRHYVLDGSGTDLRLLLSIAEVQAESARAAIRRIGTSPAGGPSSAAAARWAAWQCYPSW